MRPLLTLGLLVAFAASAAAAGYESSVKPLSPWVRQQIVAASEYHSGCPVTFDGLRLLSVTYRGFDGRDHTGQLVVNAKYAASLAGVFHRLYALRFPIHHMSFLDTYGSSGRSRPADGDFTASFECRQAAASPCSGLGVKRTGSWSNHAYGLAIDLNPVENPYVGCGMTRDKTALSYLDRAKVRRGMVTPAVLKAFASIGWGWGGAWSGSTKDYMHFSYNGH
jgi:D-alanyl-D-alanine carboxypeptidase